MRGSLLLLFFLCAALAERCLDGASCAAGTKCCGGRKNMTGPLSVCCEDSETCCPDDQSGGVCCLAQTTACCPRVGILPSRCCPRWMVCCAGGRDGCCDPGLLETRDSGATALFVKGSKLYGVAVDLSGGKQSAVPVPHFDTEGEATRRFAWDPKRRLFYLPQASAQSAAQPVQVYAVNPSTGDSRVVVVQGVSTLVTGFAFDAAGDRLLLATYSTPAKSNYTFYALDPVTFVAQKISTYTFPAGADDYAGWFQTASGDTLYRFGYLDVAQSVNPGLGVTNVGAAQATTKWLHKQPYSNYSPLPGSVVLSSSSSAMYALYTDGGSNKLHLFEFTETSPPSLVANLGNSHLPQYFGSVLGVLSGGSYHALVVKDNLLDHNFDRWALATVDLATNKSSVTDLHPFMLTASDSISGFGV